MKKLLPFLTIVLVGAGCSAPVESVPRVELPDPIVDEDAVEEQTDDIVSDNEEFVLVEAVEKTLGAEDDSAQYLNYSAGSLAAAQAAGDRVVLFFHATWCPFCVKADKDFKASIDDLPPDLTLLKVDYDSEKALKKEYGVTYQHTFVQVDSDSEIITKWISGDTGLLLKNLQ